MKERGFPSGREVSNFGILFHIFTILVSYKTLPLNALFNYHCSGVHTRVCETQVIRADEAVVLTALVGDLYGRSNAYEVFAADPSSLELTVPTGLRAGDEVEVSVVAVDPWANPTDVREPAPAVPRAGLMRRQIGASALSGVDGIE